MHVVGEPADIVVALDLGGILGAGLDHIGVQRALYQVGGVVYVLRYLLEDADEGLADDLPFLLRIGDAGKTFEEAVLRLDVHQVHVEGAAERLFHLRRFAFPEQTMVDKHAHQLVANGAVYQRGSNRRVDAAR